MNHVFQCLLDSSPKYFNVLQLFLELLVYKCFRVFADCLVDDTDRKIFFSLMNNQLSNTFSAASN
jgi:hypothetical protein